MPIYEYRCENGHKFEVLQRMSDPPVTTCEIDGGTVERVFNPIAVHFKGSGFYATDYGSKKRSRELKDAGEGKGKHEKEGASASSSGSDGKSDGGSSKPAKTESGGSGDAKSSSKSSSD
jgi:putative FmdB family regulatory protein